jgi:DNA-binding transcriptional ArsR family regulator
MPNVQHAYGRIQRRGNKYSHKINDVILDYMVVEWLDFVRKNVDGWGIPKGGHKLHSLSDIARVVRKRMNSVVSWDTIMGHVNDLRDVGWVAEDPERGANKKRYFHLSGTIRLKSRVRFIAQRLVGLDGTIVEHITDAIQTRIPNYFQMPNYYYHYFYLFPGARVNLRYPCITFL